MALEEEQEALNVLKIMPSIESIVTTAEKMDIYSELSSPLHLQVINKFVNVFLSI